jgi:hypothetical protein
MAGNTGIFHSEDLKNFQPAYRLVELNRQMAADAR